MKSLSNPWTLSGSLLLMMLALFLTVAPAQAIPAQQDATLEVEILSSPFAPVDSNGKPAVDDGSLPEVFVVQAAVTNSGPNIAADVTVTLDFQPDIDWKLLDPADTTRTIEELGVNETKHVYWFAQYPQALPPAGNSSHDYTVTAQGVNTNLAEATTTVTTRETQNTGNAGVSDTSLDVTVGVAFTFVVTYDLGVNPDDIIFSPVGNSDFDATSYRLLSTQVHFFNDSDSNTETINDQLFFDPVPNFEKAKATYTFVAVLPAVTNLCPYADIRFGTNPKYDNTFCSDQNKTKYPVDGDLTFDLKKEVSSTVIQQGQFLNYTISYTNTGDKTLEYVWIWDELPSDLASVSTIPGDPNYDADNSTDSLVVWDIGTIDPNGKGTLTFSAVVDGNGVDIPDSTSLVNQAKLGFNPGALPQNSALTHNTTTTVQAPNIAITKTDNADTANPGDSLTYVVQINNSGSVAASNVDITDALPAEVTAVSPTTPFTDTQIGQTLVWNDLGPIGSGETLQLSIPVTVKSQFFDGTVITNTATASYQNAGGHNFQSKTAQDETTIEVETTTVSLTKTATDVNGEPLAVGDTLIYTLEVENTGDVTAFDLTVTDDLPDVVTCVSISGDFAPSGCPSVPDTVVWNIPSLAAGASVSLDIEVTLDPESLNQSIINSASVDGPNISTPPTDPVVCPDGSAPVGDTCESTPGPATTLSLTKSAVDVNGEPLEVGDTISYTLEVENTGEATALNIVVTDELPVEVTCVSIAGDSAPAGCPADGEDVIWTISSLAVGSRVALEIIVTLDPESQGKSIINSADVVGGNVPTSPPPSEVCPDGSAPVEGICIDVPGPSPEAGPSPVYLPLVIKNSTE